MINKTAYIYYSKSSNRIKLEMPEGGKWVRKYLWEVLSKNHTIENGREDGRFYWYIAKSAENFDKVLEGLRKKYREVITEVEHSTRGVCTVKCQTAKGQHCECICAGEGHGGSGAYVPVRSGVLVKDEVQVVTSVYEALTAPQPVAPEPERKHMWAMSPGELIETYGEPPELTGADLVELYAMLGDREFHEMFG